MNIPLLDHGYVSFIESWGRGMSGVQEAGIIEAARQSTQGSFRGWEQDQKLLAYLYNNKHSTPFEFAGMTIEVQAPIFVFREWHRHRTQSYSEMSARYSPLPELYYVQTIERIMMSGEGNKQAGAVKGSTGLTLEAAERFREGLIEGYALFEAKYQRDLAAGVPKEVARSGMPVGHYSRMRATCNLRNWLGFMTLRCDPNAQWEIRQYANAVADIIGQEFPHTYKLWGQ